MQTLTIKVDDDYLDKIISLLKKIPKNKIKIVQDKVEKNSDAFGLLKNSIIENPVKWQQKIRTENDRDIYNEFK